MGEMAACARCGATRYLAGGLCGWCLAEEQGQTDPGRGWRAPFVTASPQILSLPLETGRVLGYATLDPTQFRWPTCCLCGTPVAGEVRQDPDQRVCRFRFRCHGREEERAVAWEDLARDPRCLEIALAKPFFADAEAVRWASRIAEAEKTGVIGRARSGGGFALPPPAERIIELED